MIVHLFLGFFFCVHNFSLFFTQLSRKVVENINLAGGSFLGVSRGGGNISEIVDSIQVIQYISFYLNLGFECNKEIFSLAIHNMTDLCKHFFLLG